MTYLVVLLACVSIAAGTRGDLRKRYGEPIYAGGGIPPFYLVRWK